MASVFFIDRDNKATTMDTMTISDNDNDAVSTAGDIELVFFRNADHQNT